MNAAIKYIQIKKETESFNELLTLNLFTTVLVHGIKIKRKTEKIYFIYKKTKIKQKKL